MAGVTILDAAGGATRFGYTLEPCTLVLEHEMTTGRVTCPALVAADGRQVALALTFDEP